MSEFAYGPAAAHCFDYYAPAPLPAQAPPSPSSLVVFVHGGAWRSEDKTEYAQLAQTLARLTSFPVAVPNYRLTRPQEPIRHPAHAADILLFLHFLSTWPGPHPSSPQPPPQRLYLLGHSCSAHMLASILLDSGEPRLAPAPQLLRAVRAAVFSEGIYDLDALCRAFPTYKDWFVADAFGDAESYAEFNVAVHPARPGAAHIRWLVLHSAGDTLVDRPQSEAMHAHLRELAGEPGDGEGAEKALARSPKVLKNFDELDEGHNDILMGDVYPRIVAEFILADAAAPQEADV